MIGKFFKFQLNGYGVTSSGFSIIDEIERHKNLVTINPGIDRSSAKVAVDSFKDLLRPEGMESGARMKTVIRHEVLIKRQVEFQELTIGLGPDPGLQASIQPA